MRMEDLPHGWADAAESVRDTIGFDYHSSIWCAPFEALYGRKCRSPVLWAEIEESSLIGPELVQETTDKVVLIKEKLKAARDHQKSYADNRRKLLEFEIKVDKTLHFVEEPIENSDREVKRLKCSRMVVVKVHLGSKREVILAEARISTANVPVSIAGAEVSIAAESLVYIRRSAVKRKDKGKAIMEESEPTQTKTKIQQEQEEALELINERKSQFAQQRAQQRRNMPLTQAQQSSTEPTDDKERALWVELKRCFEPDTDDLLELQRYMHDPLTWRLYDTCDVHHVSTKTGLDIFMLVEKDYPMTKGLPMLML
ncbi:hypothetical protein Tco_1123718 [Tanacetum coccineum]|uniref:Reverse transcriptase domain-containing protein n=1 Tax=Tanacetum coccineum TaxID=301880 RepID=A0ABQ5J6Y3_9ASTR